ncbi:hypothetical protein ACWCHM_26015 [Micromonospora sp. SCSIO 07396]
MVTPPACATPGCGRPAVAAVTTTAARIQVRTDRLDDDRTAAAWADCLHCWACTTAAVDQHIATARHTRHETEETRPR